MKYAKVLFVAIALAVVIGGASLLSIRVDNSRATAKAQQIDDNCISFNAIFNAGTSVAFATTEKVLSKVDVTTIYLPPYGSAPGFVRETYRYGFKVYYNEIITDIAFDNIYGADLANYMNIIVSGNTTAGAIQKSAEMDTNAVLEGYPEMGLFDHLDNFWGQSSNLTIDLANVSPTLLGNTVASIENITAQSFTLRLCVITKITQHLTTKMTESAQMPNLVYPNDPFLASPMATHTLESPLLINITTTPESIVIFEDSIGNMLVKFSTIGQHINPAMIPNAPLVNHRPFKFWASDMKYELDSVILTDVVFFPIYAFDVNYELPQEETGETHTQNNTNNIDVVVGIGATGAGVVAVGVVSFLIIGRVRKCKRGF